jgi:cysteine-rich repeat protein
MVRGRSAVFALLPLLLSAPALATTANDLCAPNADPCVVATPVAVTNLSVIDVGTRELRINSGGALDVGRGTMSIKAGRLTVNANGFVRASGTNLIAGGTINIDAGTIAITGSIDARGTPGGTINLTSTGDISVGGNATTPGITARALSTSEVGGTVNIVGTTVSVPGVITVFGGPDALGGDVSITATGSINLTGSIDSTGGDGGSIDIEAGAVPGAGDIVIGNSAVLRVDATIAGGFGGTLDVLARGDGVQNGNVTVEGLLSATGKTGGEDTGGGAGGCITVTADGNIVNTRASASITAAGGGPDGDGGEVEITSNHGTIEISGSSDAGSAGIESSGGSITVDASLDATINGLLTAVAGDGGGGEVDVSSDTAGVHVARTAMIDVDSSATGTGGAITLDAGTGTELPLAVLVEGALSAVGGGLGGAGGTIELDGTDSVRVTETASLHADGALGGGAGGAITIDVGAGQALIDAPMTAAGGSPSGAGGLISIDASQRIMMTAVTDARGFGVGGEVGLSSTGAVDVRGNILAGSTTAGGGNIEIVSEGEVMISASLITDGVALPGAKIDITGCTITVCGLDSPACPSGGSGILSSLGPEGRNRTTGRDATVILGTMRANNSTGHNVLLYNGNPDSEPFILGTVTPNPEITVNPDILACPACGNHNIEPPETCDDGNQLDGDGCSRTCQVEAPIPGDANGDFTLSPEDREFAVSEIFDGDGDTVGTVSGGTFAGSVGVDANDDGFVTAADLVAITKLLSP